MHFAIFFYPSYVCVSIELTGGATLRLYERVTDAETSFSFCGYYETDAQKHTHTRVYV